MAGSVREGREGASGWASGKEKTGRGRRYGPSGKREGRGGTGQKNKTGQRWGFGPQGERKREREEGKWAGWAEKERGKRKRFSIFEK